MNLTIEQMREIVDSAPLGTTGLNGGNYFKENDYGVWCIWKGYWLSNFKWPEGQMIGLDSLRTAIAEHESKMHSHLTSGVFQDDDHTDHVTDIRNHISPNTRVSEAHVNEAFKLNRLG